VALGIKIFDPTKLNGGKSFTLYKAHLTFVKTN
jgi:hypothetical protein